MAEKHEIIGRVCDALKAGDQALAKKRLGDYLDEKRTRGKSKRTLRSWTRAFLRDGFVDRYSGKPVVFSGALRAISCLMPEQFRYHPNWAVGKCRGAWWDLCATVDHIVPLALNGTNDPENLVTTTQIINSAKTNFLLEELRWKPVLSCGPEWDGILEWFLHLARNEGTLSDVTAVTEWRRAAEGANRDGPAPEAEWPAGIERRVPGCEARNCVWRGEA